MSEVDIGMAIKRARIEKNISQRQLAKQLEITPGALSSWETNRRHPPAHKLIKVTKILGIANELFGELDTKDREIEKLWKAVKKIEKQLASK